MEESSKRIRTLVREVMAEARDAVRLEDIDTGSHTTVSMSYRFGALTLRFGDSYTMQLSPEDALEFASALQNVVATGKSDQ